MAGRGYTRADGTKVRPSTKWSGASGKKTALKAAAAVVKKVAPVSAKSFTTAIKRAPKINERWIGDQLVDDLEFGGLIRGKGAIRMARAHGGSMDFQMVKNRKPVSFLRVTADRKRVVMSIDSIATMPAHQRKGYATKLLDHARQKGYSFPPEAFGRKEKYIKVTDSTLRGPVPTEYTKAGRAFATGYVKARAKELRGK